MKHSNVERNRRKQAGVYDREVYVELDRLAFMRKFLSQINYDQRSTNELHWPVSRGEVFSLPNALLTGYLGQMRLGMRKSVVVKVFRAVTDSGKYDAIALYAKSFDLSEGHSQYIHVCFLREDSVEEIVLLDDETVVPLDSVSRPQLPMVFFRYFDFELLCKRMGERWARETMLYRFVAARVGTSASSEPHKQYENMLVGEADWRMWFKFMNWCKYEDIRLANKSLRRVHKNSKRSE